MKKMIGFCALICACGAENVSTLPTLDGSLADSLISDQPGNHKTDAPTTDQKVVRDQGVSKDQKKLPDLKVLADQKRLPDQKKPADQKILPDQKKLLDQKVVADQKKYPDQKVVPDAKPQVCVHPKVVKSCTGGWCTIPAGCFKMTTSYTGTPCVPHTTREVRLTHSFVINQMETLDFIHGGHAFPFVWITAAYYCNELSKAEKRQECYSCTYLASSYNCISITNPYTCKGYRLPTEAEWEYAYRAGTTTDFYNGAMTNCLKDPLADKIAFYGGCTTPGSGGAKLPNGWGLYDMGGNASEYCHDVYQPTPGSTIEVDPVGSSGAGPASLRGGDCSKTAGYVTAYGRQTGGGGSFMQGLRCVRSL